MPHSSAKTSSLPIHRIYIFRSLSLLGVAFNFEKKSVRVEELYQRSQLSQFTGVKLTCHSLRSEMDVFFWSLGDFFLRSLSGVPHGVLWLEIFQLNLRKICHRYFRGVRFLLLCIAKPPTTQAVSVDSGPRINSKPFFPRISCIIIFLCVLITVAVFLAIQSNFFGV